MKALSLRERGQATFLLDGYRTLGNKIKFDYDFISYMESLSGLEGYVVNDYEILADEVIKSGREWLEGKYNIHNIDYCSFESAKKLDEFVDAEVAFAKDGEKFENVYAMFDDSVSSISPFDLPILFDADYGEGEICNGYLGIPTKDHILNGRKCYNNISLCGFVNDEVGATYVHEVTHSQVPCGGVVNYQNSEVLPIFNEFLYAFDLGDDDFLKRLILFRVDSIKRCTIKLNGFCDATATELLRASSYIYSTVQAFKLFDKYINSDDCERDSIINGIQSVFDGQTTVEKLLDDNDISYENSLNAQYVKKYV